MTATSSKSSRTSRLQAPSSSAASRVSHKQQLTPPSPNSLYSFLEHKWSFKVTAGDTVAFHVELYHTFNTENDHFTFAYSILYSSNLVAWNKDAGAQQVPETPNAHGVQTVAVTLSPEAQGEGGRLFVRVRAVKAP